MEEAKKILSKKNCIRIRGANEHNLKMWMWIFRGMRWLSLPDCPAPVNRRWRLIRSMRKDSGGIWNRYRPMRVSFGTDGEAECGKDRRTFSGDFDRSEIDEP